MHTFVRIPAGAVLAAGAVGDVSPAITIAAGIIGGALAAGTHATKAGSRVLINASPEPFSNWVASVSEDLLVIGGLWTALHWPWMFVGRLIVFILVMIWILPKIWRGIGSLFRNLARLFRRITSYNVCYTKLLRQSLAQLFALVYASHLQSFPVVDADQQLCGVISLHDMESGRPSCTRASI